MAQLVPSLSKLVNLAKVPVAHMHNLGVGHADNHCLIVAGSAAQRGLFGGMLMGQEQRVLGDVARQQAVAQSNIPHTIVRAGGITSTPGRMSHIAFSQVHPVNKSPVCMRMCT